jgi:hypothetical protein
MRLMPWRGKLLAARGRQGRHDIDQLIGHEWTRMLNRHSDQTSRTFSYPKIWNLGEVIVATMMDGSDPAEAGVRYVGETTFEDGYLVTSVYDFGLPARPKRLNHITAHTNVESDSDTDFKVVISYRTDDDTHRGLGEGWTVAVTANATPRAVTAELGVEFYLLQVLVQIDDDSGSNLDRRIEAITIDYSAGN